jgi:putative FmdB family regulatory protein
MPIREFLCKDCGHVFEEIVRTYEEPNVMCTHCETYNCEKLVSTFGGYAMNSGPSSVRPKQAGAFRGKKS